MRIPCPLCGERSYEEYTYLGDGTVKRPSPDTEGLKAWHDYVFVRDDPKGRHRELWHHSSGCRAWVLVERDTATHEVFTSKLAREDGGRQS